jgi:hypothetical protein
MTPTSFACSAILDRGVRAELAGDGLPLAERVDILVAARIDRLVAARAFDSRCHDATEAA